MDRPHRAVLEQCARVLGFGRVFVKNPSKKKHPQRLNVRQGGSFSNPTDVCAWLAFHVRVPKVKKHTV